MSEQNELVTLLAPLLNYVSKVKAVDIGDLQIRRLTKKEHESVSHAAGDVSWTLFAYLSASQHCITPRELPTSDDEKTFEDDIYTVVSALRLVGTGSVFTDAIYKATPTSTSLRSQLIPPAGAGDFVLTKADVKKAVALAAAIPGAVVSKKGLRRALRRFNSSYHRRDTQDRLIDNWIALEGLFLRDGNIGELRFRASLRIAHFLAEDQWETYQRVKKSYDMRSKVVHGTRVKAEEVESISTDTEDIVRRALAKAILSPGGIDLTSLDRAAVEGVNPHDPTE